MELPEVKLSDGRIARFIRKPKAADASRAHRQAGSKGNDIDRTAALLSQIVNIDDKAVVMEDVLQLDLEDFTALNEAIPTNFT
jgi:hypothetical protein